MRVPLNLISRFQLSNNLSDNPWAVGPDYWFCGFAAAHCGKPTAYRPLLFIFRRLRLPLRRSLRKKRIAPGKPEAFRYVLRQSRTFGFNPLYPKNRSISAPIHLPTGTDTPFPIIR
jgi:hypothetical protein